MAYTKIIVIHNLLDKCVDYALNEEKASLSAAIDYALNREKTEQTCFETALNCELETAYADMLATKRRWGKRVENHVRGYHVIQSFAPGEVTPEEAHAAGMDFAARLLGERYEVVVATHLNKAHYHNHVVFNSVSFMDGKMYRNQFRDYFGGDGVGIRGTSDAVCLAHGLSVIEPDPERPSLRRSRPEWEGKTTIRDSVRRDIDAAIAGAYTYKSVWDSLRRQGYEIKSGAAVKHTAVRIQGGQRFIRLDSLGADYTEEAIKYRLSQTRYRTEASPTSPMPHSPWLTPGRRYRIRGGISRPHKLTGFHALYFKYLYLLGTIGRSHTRAAFPMRRELIQLDRYQQQFLYLHRNRIETAPQLAMQYDALQAAIDVLTAERSGLYHSKRAGHGDENITAEIADITARIRPLRHDLKLCAHIEGDIPKVRQAVETQDRSIAHEKTDKSRPSRSAKAHANLSPGDGRTH